MKTTFQSGDKISVRTFNWDTGEGSFPATFIRQTSPTHAKIRVDDGLTYAVPLEDCALVAPAAERRAA